jgi:PAS domain-containing protein
MDVSYWDSGLDFSLLSNGGGGGGGRGGSVSAAVSRASSKLPLSEMLLSATVSDAEMASLTGRSTASTMDESDFGSRPYHSVDAALHRSYSTDSVRLGLVFPFLLFFCSFSHFQFNVAASDLESDALTHVHHPNHRSTTAPMSTTTSSASLLLSPHTERHAPTLVGLAVMRPEDFALYDALLDATIVIDEVGTMQYANEAVKKLLGYKPQQLLGKNVKMLMVRLSSLLFFRFV